MVVSAEYAKLYVVYKSTKLNDRNELFDKIHQVRY